VIDSIFVVWSPLPTCTALQELNDSPPSGQSETAGKTWHGDAVTVNPETVAVTVNPETLSSDPLATLLDAPQSPQDKDTSHSKCDAVGFLKSFLAKTSTAEFKELSIEDGVKILYILEQCLSSAVELDQDEMDDMADGTLNIMKDPNWNNTAAAELICQTRTIQEWLQKSEGQSWMMPDTEPASL
jgi:hypothetical protein